MRVEAKHVKFGDCIIVENDKKKLIIDCGTDNRINGKNKMKSAFEVLKPELIDNDECKVVITHFHSDHYIGFLGIDTILYPKVFDVCFLPIYYSKKNLSLGKLLALALMGAKPKGSTAKKPSKIIKLIQTLNKTSSGRIQYLTKGMTLNACGVDFDVLWPDVEILKEDITVHTKKLYEELFHKIFLLDNKNIDKNLILENVNEFEESLFNLFTFENMEQSISKFISCCNKLMSIQLYNYRGMSYFIRKVNKILHNDENACSTILQYKNELLSLGDAPASVIKILDNEHSLYTKYKLIKLPHHGTKSHYSTHIPAAEHFIISHGKYRNRIIDKRYIDNLYREKEPILHCTDDLSSDLNRCEYLSVYMHLHCSKKCSHCTCITI